MTEAQGCSASDNALVTVIPPAPFALSATAVTTTQVDLPKQFTGSKDHFEIHRNGALLTSSSSNPRDLALATITTGMVVDDSHVTQLQTAVNRVRSLVSALEVDSQE